MRTRLLFWAAFAVVASCASNSQAPDCVVGGCSGQLCVEEGANVVTTCEWRDAYACYETAACERQPDGQCGFTKTPELDQCLASHP
jgi:eight-cysteine-cluster-containing protein